MSNWDDYKREETNFTPTIGKIRCVITAVEEMTSKTSGLPMIKITVRPSKSKANVNYYIVKNDNFNKNMTAFFDAFPSIGDGNFNLIEWVGAQGGANFGLDESGYLKVKWFLSANQTASLPDFEGDLPTQQEITEIEVEEGDLPF